LQAFTKIGSFERNNTFKNLQSHPRKSLFEPLKFLCRTSRVPEPPGGNPCSIACRALRKVNKPVEM